MITDQFLFTSALLQVFFSILLLTSVMVYRMLKLKWRKQASAIQQEAMHDMTELLLEIDGQACSLEKSEKLQAISLKLKSKMYRSFLLKSFVHASLIIEGNYYSSIQCAYRRLGLARYSLAKIESGNIRQRVQGIHEISRMGATDYIPEIKKFLKSNNGLLRLEACLALIRIMPTPMFFLEDLELKFTDWEVLRIQLQLSRIPLDRLPDFSQWLDHPNDSVVVFCIKMIEHFGQWTHLHEIALLSHSEHPGIQRAAMRTMAKLNFEGLDQSVLRPADNKLRKLNAA